MPLASEQLPHEVTAIFKDAFLTFPLPPDATLGDLATRIADLGKRHDGLPIYIDVKIG